MLAFEGERVPRWVERRLADAPVAGVTLFIAYNVRDPAQVRELTDAFQRAGLAGRRAFRGREPAPFSSPPTRRAASSRRSVTRRRQFAGNMALGAVGDEALTERVGAAIGREARAMGVNVVYAPVLDLATEPNNAALGIRSFGDDPERGRPPRRGDGPRAPVGRGGRRGQALPGPGRGRPGHALSPRHRAGKPGAARGQRARPVPGGDRGRGPACDVGPCRGARADRRPDAPRDALAGRHASRAARPARLRRDHDQRRARHAGARAGCGPGGRGDRRDTGGDRPATLRRGPASAAPDRDDASRGGGPRPVRTGGTGGLERAPGRPSFLARGRGTAARSRCRRVGRAPRHLARTRRALVDPARPQA